MALLSSRLSLAAARRIGYRSLGTASGMEGFPGPTAAEFNRTAAEFNGDQYKIYSDHQNRYGDVMFQRESEFGADILTLFHPNDIKMVMQHEGKMPVGLGQSLLPFSRFYREHAPEGSNLGRIEGPEWLRVRQLMNKHLMSPKDARAYLPQLAPVVNSASASLPRHVDDLGEYLPSVTFDMICAVLLDKYPDLAAGGGDALDLRFVEVARRIFPLMAEMMTPEETPALLSGKSAIYDEFEQAMLQVMEMGAHYIAELKARVNTADKDDPVHASYLAKIMSYGELDDHQMNINFSNLIFAGVDTTSNALCWTMYHLAKNPRVQSKLRAEIAKVLEGRNVVSNDEFVGLPYMGMVIKETNRLTPPVFGSARYLHDDINIRGRTIKAGTMIRLHPLPFMFDSEVWDRNTEFLPERWTRKAITDSETGVRCPVKGEIASHPYLRLIPFSLGKRMCLGARLAEAEMFSFFARVLQDYEIALAPDSPEPVPTFKMGMIEPKPSPRYLVKAI